VVVDQQDGKHVNDSQSVGSLHLFIADPLLLLKWNASTPAIRHHP
jgi:hypothetical protein